MNETPSNTSSRKQTLLLAAAGLLAVALLAGAVFMTRPDLLSRYSGTLSGGAYKPPSVPAPGQALQPKHVGTASNMTLARATWGVGVVLWQWDDSKPEYKNARLWKTYPKDNSQPEVVYIYNEFSKEPCTDCSPIKYNYHLGVMNDSKVEGAEVIATDTVLPNGTDNQTWSLLAAGGKDAAGIQWYQIKNKNSGMCLTIAAAGTTNDSRLVQVNCAPREKVVEAMAAGLTTYDTQLWRFYTP